MRKKAPHSPNLSGQLALGLMLLACLPAFAENSDVRLDITGIGPLPGGIKAQADAVNRLGQVVGFSESSISTANPQTVFLWQNNTAQALGDVTGFFSASINDSGQALVVSGSQTATLFGKDANGNVTRQDLGALPGVLSINAAGQLVGVRIDQNNNAYRWLKDPATGNVTETPLTGAASDIVPAAINNAGIIAGYDNQLRSGRIFWNRLFTDGSETTQPLTEYITGSQYNAYSLNDGMQVVGMSNYLGDYNALLWYNAGQPINNVTPAKLTPANLNQYANNPTGQPLEQAFDISPLGQIVGVADNQGFLATPTGKLAWSAGSGSWDESSNWNAPVNSTASSLGYTPNQFLDVYAQSLEGAITIQGSKADTLVKSLTVGGGSGSASLIIGQGNLSVLNGLTVLSTGSLVSQKNLSAGGEINVAGLLENTGSFANAKAMTISGTGNFINSGAFTNQGNLNDASILSNQGALNNLGTIGIQATAILNNAAGGNLANNGAIANLGTITNTGAMVNQGALDNQGTLVIVNGGVLTNAGNLNNSGIFDNSGAFTNQGAFNNLASLNNLVTGNIANAVENTWVNAGIINNQGSISNAGVLTNQNRLENAGSLVIQAGGQLVNAGMVNNTGNLNNAGLIQNQGGLNNTGLLVNLAAASIDNSVGQIWSNTGTINNQGNVNNAGTMTNQGVFSNLGSLTLAATASLNNLGDSTLTNTGVITVQGGLTNAGVLSNQGQISQTGQMVNTGTLTNTGQWINLASFNNQGTFNQQNSLANSGQIQNTGQFTLADGGNITGQGTYQQTGGTTTVNGAWQTATLDNQGGTLNLSGGSIQANTVNNLAVFNYTAGGFSGDLNNTGMVNVSGAGSHVFNGNVLNQGTFNVQETEVAYTGNFINEGAYISDPSTNRFNNLTIGPNGFISAAPQDTYIITGNFLNASTQNTRWNTDNANLVFASPANGQAAQHEMQLAGENKGAKASGAINNFAWGTVTLNSGNRLNLSDGNATAGAALYVRQVNLPGGVGDLSNISGDFDIYFDPTDPANQGLLGGGRFGSGSGRLLPWSFVPFDDATIDSIGLTPNERGFALALNEACSAPTGALTARCVELQALNQPQQEQAIASATPDQAPGQTGVSVKFSATRMNAPFTRLAALRAGSNSPFALNINGRQIPTGKLAGLFGKPGKGGAAGDEDLFRDSPLGVYLQARFNFGDQTGTAWERGYDFQSRNITAGADYRLTDQLIVGAAFNYVNTTLNYVQSAGRVENDTYIGAVYGSYYMPEDFYVDWVANYGGNDYSFRRQFYYPGFAGQTNSNPGGNQFTFAVNGGKEFHWQEWLLNPYIRFEYTNLHIEAYQETGGSGLGVTTGGQTNHSFVSDLGFQLSHAVSLPWGVLTPALRFEWEHQYLNDNRLISMRLSDARPGLGYFGIQTGNPDRDYLNLGGSVSAALPNGGGVFVRYESRLGQFNMSEHIVEGGVRLTF